MGIIVCVLTTILTSISMSKEKEQGTFELLISAPIKPWEILIGKTIPYFILGLVDVILIILAAMLIFGVPLRGPAWALGIAAIFFTITTVNIGMLISTFAKNQQQAMMGTFMFLFPAILLSGVMSPVENMPMALQVAAYCNPLMYFVELARLIMLKGENMAMVFQYTGILAMISVVTISITFKRFKLTL